MKMKLLRWFYRLLKKTPADMEMVRYWKTQSGVQAKVTEKDGVTIMIMEGEIYPFPGFPRGYLLYGKLSMLKHEIKNRIFNDSWAKLEQKISEKEIISEIKQTVTKIDILFEENKYDIIPLGKMVPAMQEIYRAWTAVSPRTEKLRDLILFILQEDDSYRFLNQWIVGYMPTWIFRFINPIWSFEKALIWLENAEIIGDMKERIRLFRRIIMLILKDEQIKKEFVKLFREINWKKVKLTKADKYFFRGKYFKVDLDKFEY